MKRFLGIIYLWMITMTSNVFALPDKLTLGSNKSDIIRADGMTPIAILTLIQSFLLKVLLPLVVIGAALYIAYELFTAEGDESKMKRAWKSVAYSAIGLIAIALSYAIVNIISRLSF